MRQDRIIQASIFDLFSEHEIGRELKAMSAWLDAHREVIALVAAEAVPARASSQPGAMGCRPSRCCAARCSSNTGS